MPVRELRAVVVLGVAAMAGGDLFTVDGLTSWLSGYPALLVLPLIAVTGETVVLAAVIVASQSSWSMAEVVLWCFVGTVASDWVWFRLAGVAGNRLFERRTPGDRQERVLAWLRARTGERPQVALLFVKFLYGSRFLMLVYLATRRLATRQFLVYDAIGTAVWLAVLVPIGWLLGVGALQSEVRIELFGLAIVAVLLMLRGGSSWITSRAQRPSPRS